MTSVSEPEVDKPIDIHTTAGKLEDLRRRSEETLHPVGQAAVDKVHEKGKLTARERILALLDEGSFVELDALAKHRSTNFGLGDKHPLGDGVVTGYGTIDGRDVCIFSQDATVFGGSLGEVYGEKIVKVQELAIKTGRPLIGINDGAGARIQEGVVSLGLYSRIFRNNILASGVIPQISLIMGAAAGGHVYSPALTDFIIMVDQTSQMFITGPDVIKTVTGEEVTMEELGGAHTHEAKSGTVHYVASGEQDALDYVRDLLSYLPANNYAEPPRYPEPPHPGAIEDNLTAEDLELVAAEGRDEEAQANGLEHEEFGEGSLEGGEIVVAVGAGEGEEGALHALEAGVAAAAGGGASPGFELLRDLDKEGVADALVELTQAGIARVPDGLEQ